jgi:hypothetical protein
MPGSLLWARMPAAASAVPMPSALVPSPMPLPVPSAHIAPPAGLRVAAAPGVASLLPRRSALRPRPPLSPELLPGRRAASIPVRFARRPRPPWAVAARDAAPVVCGRPPLAVAGRTASALRASGPPRCLPVVGGAGVVPPRPTRRRLLPTAASRTALGAGTAAVAWRNAGVLLLRAFYVLTLPLVLVLGLLFCGATADSAACVKAVPTHTAWKESQPARERMSRPAELSTQAKA